jgi:FAD:protein FMN transferase
MRANRTNWKFVQLATLTFALTAIAVLVARGNKPAPQAHLYMAHYENVMGTSFDMKTLAANEDEAGKAESAALAEIDRETKILSSWDPKSEFSKWFQTQDQPIRVSPELFEVLSLFDQWRARTSGALDPAAEAITRVWQKAAAEKRIPTHAELNAAVASVRVKPWKLDAANRTATHTSRTPLAMNSFVKSYIIGHSVDAAMRVGGVSGVEVNVGGDLVVRGNWSEKVDIADPREDADNAAPIERLSIQNNAVATSGDYRRGVEINGRHYSHIIDPRTGEPSEQVISSTVISDNPSTAGALATAFSVMEPQKSKQLAESIPGVEYMLIEADGTILRSPGWSALELPDTHPVLAQERKRANLERVSTQPTAAEWNTNYKLTIGMQLTLFEQYRVRRPYVAVWVVDATDGRSVRTLAVWFNKPRYLHELSEWFGTVYASNEQLGNHLLDTISSATRPPGSYTFEWDGKDDSGKLVKPGKYIVYIEAAREHGTHQLMKQEMDFDGTSQRINLRGGMEISSAYLDYHKDN